MEAKKPLITEEIVDTIFESKYINVYDIRYSDTGHYYNATRRTRKDMTAFKSEDQFKALLADAVTCAVILQENSKEPRLLLAKEFRYPTGQFILCPPAGLIDDEDKNSDNPLITTAIREIYEETGLKVSLEDDIRIVNPLLFSTPGMTDESNAIVCVVVKRDNFEQLNQSGCVGSECFDGFELVSENEARDLIKKGTDKDGLFYSTYTWICMMYFISGMWKE